jgi:hypothetical protein
MDKSHVYFGVFNFDEDFATITQALGLVPSETWRKGDPATPKGIRTHTRWSLRSPVSPSHTFQQQIRALLPLLEDHAEGVRDIARRYAAGIRCYAYYHEEYNPEVHLPADLVQRIAALGLSVDFDLYFLPDDNPKKSG